MTIEKTATSVTYGTASVAEELDVPFPVLDGSHIVVAAFNSKGAPVDLVAGRDYQIKTVGPPGVPPDNRLNPRNWYKIVLKTPLPSGGTMTIRRSVPITQEVAFNNQTMVVGRVVENALDKLTLVCQELDGGISSLDEKVADNMETVSDRLGDVKSTLAGLAEKDRELASRFESLSSELERAAAEVEERLRDLAIHGSEKLLLYDNSSKLICARECIEGEAESLFLYFDDTGLVCPKGVFHG